MNGETINLGDIAKAIRSKNAKSFHLTLDVFFNEADTYARVKNSGVITKEDIQELYHGLEMTEFVWFDPGSALKVTFRRPQSVGSPGDTDVFGCQQHALLYEIELPAKIVAGEDWKDEVVVLVIGSALREVCGDQSALGLRFLESVNTAPKYRLFVVEDRFAALVKDEVEGTSVPGELVEVSKLRWAEIVADEPQGITFETIDLADGRAAVAAVSDPKDPSSCGIDITDHGGFAAYWSAKHQPPAV